MRGSGAAYQLEVAALGGVEDRVGLLVRALPKDALGAQPARLLAALLQQLVVARLGVEVDVVRAKLGEVDDAVVVGVGLLVLLLERLALLGEREAGHEVEVEQRAEELGLRELVRLVDVVPVATGGVKGEGSRDGGQGSALARAFGSSAPHLLKAARAAVCMSIAIIIVE